MSRPSTRTGAIRDHRARLPEPPEQRSGEMIDIHDRNPAGATCPLHAGEDRMGEEGTPVAVREELPTMPFLRPSVLELAPIARELQEKAPVVRVRTPMGDEVWMVTGYQEVKEL